MSKKIERKQTKSLTHRETAESWFPVRDWASAFCLGVLSPGPKTSRELLTPGSINQWKLPQRPPPVSNTQHYPTLSTQWRIPHRTAGKTTIQIQSSADRYPKAYHLTQPCPSRRKKTHLLPPERRHKSLPTQSIHKPRDQSFSLMAETKRKKEYMIIKPRKRRPQTH